MFIQIMKKDTATVTITVHKQHHQAFLEFIGCAPDDRDEVTHPSRVNLTFVDWSNPRCEQFHCPHIPFVGYHGMGEAFEPGRMCGDGDSCMEIYATQEKRLYVLVDEMSGFPDWESNDAVHGYLSFERECHEVMKNPQTGTAR
jgi:hypothetical protein